MKPKFQQRLFYKLDVILGAIEATLPHCHCARYLLLPVGTLRRSCWYGNAAVFVRRVSQLGRKAGLAQGLPRPSPIVATHRRQTLGAKCTGRTPWDGKTYLANGTLARWASFSTAGRVEFAQVADVLTTKSKTALTKAGTDSRHVSTAWRNR